MKVIDRIAETNIPKVVPKTPFSWRGVLLLSVEIFVCAILVIVVLESVLAFAGLGEEENLRMEPLIGWVPMEGKHITQRVEGFSRASFNSMGMPDIERSKKKPAGVFRIALIGDSYTEGFSVHPGHRFGDLLEKRLKSEFPDRQFEVLNFGVPAYNIAQKYLRLKHFALDFEPDIAIMQTRPYETLYLGPSLSGWTSAKPDFSLDAQDRLIEDRTQQVRWNKSAEGRRMRNTYWLRRYSRIWCVVGHQIESLSVWQRQTWRGWNGVLKGKWLAAAPDGKAKTHDASSSQLQPAMKYLCRQAGVFFEKSKEEAEKRGCKFAVVLFPRAPGLEGTIESEEFRLNCRKNGIAYDDMGPQFDTFPAHSQKRLFAAFHLSNEGNQVAADRLFEFLSSSGLLEQGKPHAQ